MAKGLFEQARSSLQAARQALRDGHWAYAVRTSQDASELFLKALLLSAGAEPPKSHDLGGTLRKNEDRLRRLGLGSDEVESLARTAGSLAEDRSKALYGDERRKVPASRLYKEKDAHDALKAAQRVHSRCLEAATAHRTGGRPLSAASCSGPDGPYSV
jgi:HEPN domain-containing protein